MHNGIGLRTPRGSGTNGYVQRSLAVLPVNKIAKLSHQSDSITRPKSRVDPQIILHEKKREIELKLLELRTTLRTSMTEEEIEEEINKQRKHMLNNLNLVPLNVNKNHHIMAELKNKQITNIENVLKIKPKPTKTEDTHKDSATDKDNHKDSPIDKDTNNKQNLDKGIYNKQNVDKEIDNKGRVATYKRSRSYSYSSSSDRSDISSSRDRYKRRYKSSRYKKSYSRSPSYSSRSDSRSYTRSRSYSSSDSRSYSRSRSYSSSSRSSSRNRRYKSNYKDRRHRSYSNRR
uniref:Cwf21 domain containing protein, putative n=1 Tax=Theileria annulata TaxID=5874 RepID=A0A3B0MJE4_THEAN